MWSIALQNAMSVPVYKSHERCSNISKINDFEIEDWPNRIFAAKRFQQKMTLLIAFTLIIAKFAPYLH
jgi:hypothetical protein